MLYRTTGTVLAGHTVQQQLPPCSCCTVCPGVIVDDLAAPEGVDVDPNLE
jgi:hypothetical protein